MTDNLSRENRQKTMRAVKSKNTNLEKEVMKFLWKKNMRFQRNAINFKGKPDILINKYKIVIFLDSCFWHGCKLHASIPKTNRVFWESKLNKNKLRDICINKYYINNKWHILRIWEHDLKKDFNKEMRKIINFINYWKVYEKTIFLKKNDFARAPIIS